MRILCVAMWAAEKKKCKWIFFFEKKCDTIEKFFELIRFYSIVIQFNTKRCNVQMTVVLFFQRRNVCYSIKSMINKCITFEVTIEQSLNLNWCHICATSRGKNYNSDIRFRVTFFNALFAKCLFFSTKSTHWVCSYSSTTCCDVWMLCLLLLLMSARKLLQNLWRGTFGCLCVDCRITNVWVRRSALVCVRCFAAIPMRWFAAVCVWRFAFVFVRDV